MEMLRGSGSKDASRAFEPASYGAVGDGRTLDTVALQAALDNAHAAGGGSVALQPGKTYLSGSLIMRSNVNLHVPAGSELQASGKWEDITERFPEGTEALVAFVDNIY